MFLVRGYYHIRLTVCCVHLLDNGRIILLYLCVYHRCGVVGGSAARGLNVFVAETTTIRTEISIVRLYALRHEPDRTDTRRPTWPLDVGTARCALA